MSNYSEISLICGCLELSSNRKLTTLCRYKVTPLTAGLECVLQRFSCSCKHRFFYFLFLFFLTCKGKAFLFLVGLLSLKHGLRHRPTAEDRSIESVGPNQSLQWSGVCSCVAVPLHLPRPIRRRCSLMEGFCSSGFCWSGWPISWLDIACGQCDVRLSSFQNWPYTNFVPQDSCCLFRTAAWTDWPL